MTLHVYLLGEFRVTDGDRDLPPGAWEHRRSAELIKLVALAGARERRRQGVPARRSAR
jgi:hypothetical protein